MMFQRSMGCALAMAACLLLPAYAAHAEGGLSLPKLPITLLSEGIPSPPKESAKGAPQHDNQAPEDGESNQPDDPLELDSGDIERAKRTVARDTQPPVPSRVKTEKSNAKLPLPIIGSNGQARTLPQEEKPVSVADVAKQIVPVTPGVVEVQPIALGHLNRIEAPFDHPQVRTVSNVDVQINDRILYVMTKDPGPISLYITTPDESVAVSLALVGKKIPPRDIRLVLGRQGASGTVELNGAPNPMARKLEEAQPYVETLREIITTTAKGEIPSGYSFQELRAEHSRDIHYCYIDGLEIEPRQRLDGHSYIVTVSRVLNPTVYLREIDESLCYREGVVAVAAWPEVVLRPGEQTELIIIQRREVFKPSYSQPRRPSAIGR